MADFIPKNLANGQLAVGKTTLYTVPAGKTAIIQSVVLVNTDTAAAHEVNLYVDFGAGSRRFIPTDMNLPRGAQFSERKLNITLEEGDIVEGDCDAFTTVDYIISGVEN